MKKLILIIAAALTMSAVAVAQPKAVGIRLGYGAEVSYQHILGADNFMEVDLGWFSNGFSGSVAYDFNVAEAGNFGFYVGPQVSFGTLAYDGSTKFNLGAGAQLGVEYEFDIPLNISLDWKPTFYFVPGTAFGWSSIALGLRYRF